MPALTTDALVTLGAKRVARARGITVAAAAGVLRDNPDVLAQLRIELTDLTAEQIDAFETIERFETAPPASAATPPATESQH